MSWRDAITMSSLLQALLRLAFGFLLLAPGLLRSQLDTLPVAVIEGPSIASVCSGVSIDVADASFNPEGGCVDSLKRYWFIEGSASVVQMEGSLGTPGASFDFDEGTSGTEALELIFEGPGDVVVWAYVANACGYDSASISFSVAPGGPITGLESLQDTEAICTGESIEADIDTGHESDTIFWSVTVEPGLSYEGAASGWGVSPFEFTSGPFINDSPSDREIDLAFWRACGGPVTTHAIEVHPEVSISVVAQDTACTGTPWFALVNADVHGVEVAWTVDEESPVLGAQAGSGPFVYDPLENLSDSLQAMTYTFTTPDAVCPADAFAYSVYVAPAFDLPELDATYFLCSGDSVEVSDYSIEQVGVDYGWTYQGDELGIPASGLGLLAGVTVENSTQQTLEGTLHLEAYFLGCTNQIDYDLNVLPTPELGVDSTMQAVCSNVPLGIAIVNEVEGALLEWEVLAAPSITGAAGGFNEGSVTLMDTLVNAGAFVDTVRYVFATPTYQCPADPVSLSLLVAPDLSLVPLESQHVCDGEWVQVPSVELPLQQVEYAWYLESGGGVGLDSSGLGPLPSWQADLGGALETAFAQVHVQVDGFGCVDSTHLAVEVEPIPVIELFGWTDVVCSDVPLAVEVGSTVSDAGVVWEWISPPQVTGLNSFGGAGIFDVPVNSDTANATVNVLFYTEGSFCFADSVEEVFDIRPSFQLPELDPAAFCNGTLVAAPFEVSEVPGVEQFWLNSNPAMGLSDAGLGVVPEWTALAEEALEATVVQVSAYADCPNDTSIWSVQIHPTPQLSHNVGPNGGLDCQTGLATIEGFSSTGFGAFTWSGPGNVTPDGNSASVDAAGEYVLAFVDDATGCEASDTAMVAPPEPMVIQDVLVDSLTCFGIDDGRIELVVEEPSEVFFEWSPAVSFGEVAQDLAEGNYQVWAINASNCVASVEVELVSPVVLQVALVDSSPSICGVASGYLEVEASGGLGGYVYDWGGQTGERLGEVDAGVYEVVVTDSAGCTVFSSFEIECAMELPILVNQLITPNEDGFNDRLVIEDLHLYPGHTLQVFNRWGGLVYEAAPYLNDWEGTWDAGEGAGQPLPSATYYFLFETGVDWVLPFRGYVELQNEGR